MKENPCRKQWDGNTREPDGDIQSQKTGDKAYNNPLSQAAHHSNKILCMLSGRLVPCELMEVEKSSFMFRIAL
jgi:hypothetical protein